VLLLLCCGAMLLPVKLAIKANTHLQPQYGKYVYWFPTDGKTSFYQYYFFYEKFGYRNSALLIMSGLLGILLLPLARERFRDAAMRSTALFLPVATLGCLALAFLARNFLPARRAQPIPLTPFTTKRVWDLIKDIPQWYVQIICGIIFVLMLDALVRKIPLAHKARRAIFLWVSLAAAGVCLSANLSMVAALKDPAHFYSYGGNKNNPFALVLESIHRNPDVTHIFMQSGVAAFDMNWFFFDIQNYFPARKFRIIRDSDLEKWPSLFPPGTSLLVANHYSFSKWQALCKKQGVFSARQLVDFQKTDEGIYLVARK
jgi:hypothetical protein